MPEYNLSRFDMAKIPTDSTVGFFGKRGAGKTTLLREFLYRRWRIPTWLVFSGSEAGNGDFQRHIPGTYIYDELDRAALLGVLRTQMRLRAHNIQDKSYRPPPVAIIIEDMSYDMDLGRDKLLRFLFMNGRQFNILILISVQYMMDLHRSVRSMINFAFFLREPVPGNRERIHSEFGGILRDFNEFEKLFLNITDDRGCCMVVDMTSFGTRVEDWIFWYKSTVITADFKVGCEEYWREHYRRASSEQLDAEARIDSHLRKLIDSTSAGARKRKREAEAVRLPAVLNQLSESGNKRARTSNNVRVNRV
jgi:hypothetical protein